MKNHLYTITITENKVFWQVDVTKIATAIDLSEGGHVTYGTFKGINWSKKIFWVIFQTKTEIGPQEQRNSL